MGTIFVVLTQELSYPPPRETLKQTNWKYQVQLWFCKGLSGLSRGPESLLLKTTSLCFRPPSSGSTHLAWNANGLAVRTRASCVWGVCHEEPAQMLAPVVMRAVRQLIPAHRVPGTWEDGTSPPSLLSAVGHGHAPCFGPGSTG